MQPEKSIQATCQPFSKEKDADREVLLILFQFLIEIFVHASDIGNPCLNF